MTVSLSILDLVPVPEGTPASAAVRASVDLARLGESLGFARYWISEHHGMPVIASSAPELLLTRIGALTERIRIGSGGIMLPNHVPMRVAENFRTLEALYPGRVDLGIGRAPGSNVKASRALRSAPGEKFGEMFNEMLSLARGELPRTHPFSGVAVMPDDVDLPPIWILGSSGASATAAGRAGMGYGFASHFSPMPAAPPMQAYREAFEPSAAFPRPHAILCASVVCAETDEEAERLAATVDLMSLRISRGEFPPLPSPQAALDYPYDEHERILVAENRERHIVGGPDKVKARLERMLAETGADELMVVCNLYEPEARFDTYRRLARLFA
ncbi:MAG: 5,10-methylene tetrahydromethanopterin reductase [Salinisphaeraceae bacterium]|jgi:luciferase family oxidoreductase group 1|nr:5,10-methylene tetrahydromethanopterin reductase [Salinisphaeraceae bacterium]